jgi:hypothetical protein
MESQLSFKHGLQILQGNCIRVKFKVGSQKWTDDYFRIQKIEDCHTSDANWTVLTLKGEGTKCSSLIDLQNITGIISEKNFNYAGLEGNKLIMDNKTYEVKFERNIY